MKTDSIYTCAGTEYMNKQTKKKKAQEYSKFDINFHTHVLSVFLLKNPT